MAQSISVKARNYFRTHPKPIVLACLGMMTGLFIILGYQYLPTGIDWYESFRPAVLNLLHGQDPYDPAFGFYNPPWVLIPLIPLAILPARLGFAILFVANLYALIVLAIRMGANKITLAIFLLSYPVLWNMIYGQLDGLLLLGLLLPPEWGLILLLAKPQIGLGVAIYWGAEAWRKDRLWGLVRLSIPSAVCFAASYLVFGPWFLASKSIPGVGWNLTGWPVTIPIGMILLYSALKERRLNRALMAAPLLSPYTAPQSWLVGILGLLPETWQVLLGSIGSWIVVYFFHNGV